MSRGEKHTAEQIIGKLREAEIAISQGQTAAAAAKSTRSKKSSASRIF